MWRVLMEDNIITLDFNKDKEGEICLTELENLAATSNWYAEFSYALLVSVENVCRRYREEAGLSGVDFHLMYPESLPEQIGGGGILNPTITLEGEDDSYNYMMVIIIELDEADDTDGDIPVKSSAFARVIRIPLDAKEESPNLEVYDPEREEWFPTDYEEEAGIPKALREIVTMSPEDRWKLDILRDYMDEYGEPSKEEFEKILRDNRTIISLNDSFGDFTELWFRDKENLCIEMYAHDGGRVIYENGFFILQAVIDGEVIQSVFRTKNMLEMREVVMRFFNRACREDVVAIVPLSKEAFMIVKDNGDGAPYIFSNERKSLTKKERKLSEKYVREFFS